MFRALVRTAFAPFSTKPTNRAGAVAVARQDCRSRSTELSAIDVQLNTAHHRCNVFLSQALSRAIIASVSTGVACIDTAFQTFGIHDVSFDELMGDRGALEKYS